MIINKPPMGWNSWNTFGEKINEEVVLKSAESLIKNGLAEIGYKYVVIDDCWSLKERDENGRLAADPKKFPHGIKYVADKIHGMGLKFGMYSCAGLMTCAGYPSSLDREWVDAQTFADWGVDYLKYDFCYHPWNRRGEDLYRAMGFALSNCGRDILFSACSWGTDQTHEWIRTTGANIWRSTGDIFDNWESVKNLILEQKDRFAFGGKGCFNDMDMLVVGMRGKGHVGLGGCSDAEYRTHFAAWCMLQSPLMIGCDVNEMDDFTLNLLKNPILLGINQDEKCAQTYRCDACYDYDHGDYFILIRLLSNGDLAIGYFNLSDGERNIIGTLSDFGINVVSNKKLELQNCWTHEKSYSVNGIVEVKLPAHESVVFRARIVSPN